MGGVIRWLGGRWLHKIIELIILVARYLDIGLVMSCIGLVSVVDYFSTITVTIFSDFLIVVQQVKAGRLGLFATNLYWRLQLFSLDYYRRLSLPLAALILKRSELATFVCEQRVLGVLITHESFANVLLHHVAVVVFKRSPHFGLST